ncbi:MAG: HPr kinase/phosphatase C-terminal domain-containing protein [Methylobacteriaceae bacterium]|nr:HPr kinase/phosphatase C-terminal domain-containing protein [Methylobacteriaceae bacterium]
MNDAPAPPAIHATAVVVGETGVLLRGPSGAGKSAVALALIEFGARRGLFARLVADDRVRLAAVGGRLVASPHPAIAGRIERRGQGIEATPHLSRAVIGLVVDIAADGPRLPEPADRRATIAGVELDRMTVGADPLAAAAAILARLRTAAAPR